MLDCPISFHFFPRLKSFKFEEGIEVEIVYKKSGNVINNHINLNKNVVKQQSNPAQRSYLTLYNINDFQNINDFLFIYRTVRLLHFGVIILFLVWLTKHLLFNENVFEKKGDYTNVLDAYEFVTFSLLTGDERILGRLSSSTAVNSSYLNIHRADEDLPSKNANRFNFRRVFLFGYLKLKPPPRFISEFKPNQQRKLSKISFTPTHVTVYFSQVFIHLFYSNAITTLILLLTFW